MVEPDNHAAPDVDAVLLNANDVAKDRFDGFFVADQIIVDNKDNPKPSALEDLELGQDLFTRLEAWPPTEGYPRRAAREQAALTSSSRQSG